MIGTHLQLDALFSKFDSTAREFDANRVLRMGFNYTNNW